jgi:citronellol/citronellal dehydrogenase
MVAHASADGQGGRTPEIVADAAHAILTRGRDFTGNFLIDEDVLREEGTVDFERYAVAPGAPLQPDLFLDDDRDSVRT